jgi:uncharacterized protein
VTRQPAPTPLGERIEVLDLLRGFALLGIAIVNIAPGSVPVLALAADLGLWKEGPDRVAYFLVHWLAEGKFFPLFSFLFGLGFGLQMERVEARGGPFRRLYLRRLAALLLIGVVHAFLIWYGDILMLYALLGFLLFWLFRRREPRTLLRWALVSLALPIVLFGALTVLLEVGRAVPEARAGIEQSFAEQAASTRAAAAEATRVYGQGSYLEVTAQRARDVAYLWSITPLFFMPNVFGMMLLGLYAARRGILADVEAHLGLFRWLLRWGLPIGLLANLVYALASEASSRAVPSLASLAGTAALGLGGPLMALSYAAGLSLLVRNSPAWRQRLRPVSLAGRMALTNYLLQSLIQTLFYYGYGLGFYGTGPAFGIAFAVAIYLAELAFSAWWLARYRFGPAEWLWRSLTYGAAQPMRATTAAAAA